MEKKYFVIYDRTEIVATFKTFSAAVIYVEGIKIAIRNEYVVVKIVFEGSLLE